MHRFKLRYVLTMGALLSLPAFACGVAPVVLDLMARMEAVEAQLDAQPVVVDANGIQVGVVT